MKNFTTEYLMTTFFKLLLCFTVTLVTTFQSSASDFVGSKACVDCHEQAYQDWQGSHHDMSMKHATKDSVLGDFDNATYYFKDKRTTKPNKFYKKGTDDKPEFWVNIQDGSGEFKDYQIKYTFAFEPLQQYMVEFDDGRIQLIPFAWDSRTKEEGGQQWFNLYPMMANEHQDFFWTNTGQNWNYMCADCHSTNVDKNFDIDTNTYNTTYSEINVACESCHGAASDHLTWADKYDKAANKETLKADQGKGFNRDLTKTVKEWQPGKKGTLTPKNVEHSQQVLVCAQCHSRRTQISEKSHVDGNAFGERYLLDLISSTNYYPDGQIYDEVFVYGSFLQSKMYKAGVVCTDCHNPHSTKLKLPAEVVCLQCHQADEYAVEKHHKHPEDSVGAQCINCHMPETTYMKVDPRRDHGFHNPTPKLADQLGTPDTCLTCHDDEESDWMAHKVNTWYPNSKTLEDKDFAASFSASTLSLTNQELSSVTSELSRIAQTTSYSGIIRASALTKMASTSNTNTIIAIARGVKDPDENIRLGAIEGAERMAGAEKWRVLSPLLTDKVLAVRINSAFALASLWQNLSTEQKSQLNPILDEYLVSQRFNNDRSYSHSNRGIIAAYKGDYDKAIKAFETGINIEKTFAQTYLNLSQVYYQLGNNQKSIETLKQGSIARPDDASLAYNAGLAYIRVKDTNNAAKQLAVATKLAPQNSHYFYVYGLSLEQQQPNAAYDALSQAFKLSNNPQHLYALCDMQARHKSPRVNQCIAQLTPLVPENVIQGLKQLSHNK